MASVAEWLRRLSVAQETTGSSPVARPNRAYGINIAYGVKSAPAASV